MENERYANEIFKSENCRAKNSVAGLIDCLSPQQAHLCGSFHEFGCGYFCKHLRRNEFVETTQKSRNNLEFLVDVSHSDDQE